MGTTVFVSPQTRDLLKAAKKELGAKSIDETIRRLLQKTTPTALDLFRAHEEEVRAVCRKWGLTRLIAFGSRARGDARPDSDLDLVTEFSGGTSLLDVVRIKEELGAAFGCPVDLGSIPPADTRLAAHIREEGVALVAPSA